jgi:hypothetical protein
MPPAYLAGPTVHTEHVRNPTCAGKVGFDSPSLAIKVRDRSDRNRSVFRCDKCGLWHLGRERGLVAIHTQDAYKLGLIRREARSCD